MILSLVICSYLQLSSVIFALVICSLGGGGKALTMIMAPWNLPHGQWSKLTNFEHLTTVPNS